MPRLSPTQERALVKLAGYDRAESAYTLQESLATLKALCRRGLAESKEHIGSFFFPRNNIEFEITGAGRMYVDAHGLFGMD